MNLNYILIGSPDKLSLNSFIRFMKRAVGKDFIIGDMHSLMSDESKNLYIEDFIKKNPRGIFSYYAKGVKSSDPLKCLPEKAINESDVAVWFDLYSTEPIVLKDKENFLAPIIQNWNKYIETLNT